MRAGRAPQATSGDGVASGPVIWNATFAAGVFVFTVLAAISAGSGRRSDFLVSGGNAGPIANAMAAAAAALSVSVLVVLPNLFAFEPARASAMVSGVVLGIALLGLLFAAPLKRSGATTLAEFLGERHQSALVQLAAGVGVAVIAFLVLRANVHAISVIFERFLDAPRELGAGAAAALLAFCVLLGGMRASTHVQAGLYAILAFAFLTPVTFATLLTVDGFLPQDALFAPLRGEEVTLGERLELALFDLGFSAQELGQPSRIDLFTIALCVAAGVAVAPHVLGRFVTVSSPGASRISAAWALVLVAAPLTAAPAIGAFSRLAVIEQVHDTRFDPAAAELGEALTPDWFRDWRAAALVTWRDVNQDGRVAYFGPNATAFDGADAVAPLNETTVSEDAFAFGLPSALQLPRWTAALGVAGALAAALATGLGALLAFSLSVGRDICRGGLAPRMPDWQETAIARLAAVVAAGAAVGFALGDAPGWGWREALALSAAGLFAPMALAALWPRAVGTGALAAMAAGFATVSGALAFGVADHTYTETAGGSVSLTPESAGAAGLCVALLVGVVASLLGPRPSPDARAAERRASGLDPTG